MICTPISLLELHDAACNNPIQNLLGIHAECINIHLFISSWRHLCAIFTCMMTSEKCLLCYWNLTQSIQVSAMSSCALWGKRPGVHTSVILNQQGSDQLQVVDHTRLWDATKLQLKSTQKTKQRQQLCSHLPQGIAS